jgi:hypothetical protein
MFKQIGDNKLNIMRNQILQQIITALGLRNTFFLRELDIQIYLTNYFKNLNLNDNLFYDNVFVEYHIPSNLIPNYPWGENIYIDIVLEKDGLYYPIEIKFKTQRQQLPLLVFGNNINVTLEYHGAKNIGCYDFWKDVKRIELFEQTFNNVKRGVVLFVSNDITYQNAPGNPNVGYAQFSIHQGRVIPINSALNWNGNLAVANGRPPITTNYAYSINWSPLVLPNHHYILT